MPLGANLMFVQLKSASGSRLRRQTDGPRRPLGYAGPACFVEWGTEQRLFRVQLLTRSGIIVDKTCDKL